MSKEEEIFESFFFEEDFLKKVPYDLCMHLRRFDSKIWLYNKRFFEHFNIPINPSRKKPDQPYAVEYMMLWTKIIIDTYSPLVNALDVNPLDYITDQLKKNQKIFQEIEKNNKKEFDEIKSSKRKLVDKIDQDSRVAMQSV